jgi:PP-loop superfamily ATP-utilizing enzyme
MEAKQKYEKLKGYLKDLGSVAIAFSSGVDSTFLLKCAHDVLGYRTGSMNEMLKDDIIEAGKHM